jgi:hypothetical protein
MIGLLVKIRINYLADSGDANAKSGDLREI